MSDIKESILGEIGDVVMDFVYYDRQEDDDLPVGKIEEAIAAGEITTEEIVNRFHSELIKGLTRRGQNVQA